MSRGNFVLKDMNHPDCQEKIIEIDLIVNILYAFTSEYAIHQLFRRNSRTGLCFLATQSAL